MHPIFSQELEVPSLKPQWLHPPGLFSHLPYNAGGVIPPSSGQSVIGLGTPNEARLA